MSIVLSNSRIEAVELFLYGSYGTCYNTLHYDLILYIYVTVIVHKFPIFITVINQSNTSIINKEANYKEIYYQFHFNQKVIV